MVGFWLALEFAARLTRQLCLSHLRAKLDRRDVRFNPTVVRVDFYRFAIEAANNGMAGGWNTAHFALRHGNDVQSGGVF